MTRLSRPEPQSLIEYAPARIASSADLPWIPISPEKSWKPLRFFADDRGFVQLFRMEPGTMSPLQRHTGEVHAFNLGGQRQLCTGEVIGPGDYVYERPGNIDTWKVVGDEPLTVLVVVMGRVEFLGPDHGVTGHLSAQTQLQTYHAHCGQHGLPVLNLVE
ncbi:cupin domain-containing protein [Dokdonella soli]|uniref:ChrR-like cupin domain-containing protein n=1 Tax=Dokdonella soli TaxID=529810 RepID=A0ABP3TIP2_9GAMM